MNGRVLPVGAFVCLLRETLEQDPFYTNGVADFEVMEFHAARVAPGYEILLDS